MTSAIDLTVVPDGGWTTDLLDQFPEDGVRREILDGVLLVSPSPNSFHQNLLSRLGAALLSQCPPHLSVNHGVDVRINRRRSFIPDVLVVPEEAMRVSVPRFTADQVVLAIEVVSPSSVAIDRVLKPAVYAEAGIANYWRIELKPKPVTATTYELISGGIYKITGEHRERLRVSSPWEIDIDLSQVAPR